jgi:hypothetical protein
MMALDGSGFWAGRVTPPGFEKNNGTVTRHSREGGNPGILRLWFMVDFRLLLKVFLVDCVKGYQHM